MVTGIPIGRTRLARAFTRVWNSPTLMSWASMTVRLLNPFVILPLVLVRFDAPEINVWNLLLIIIGLQVLIDLGFAPTLSRLFAYGMGGARELPARSSLRQGAGTGGVAQPNWDLLAEIWSTARGVYIRLGLASFVGIAALAGLAMWRPMGHLASPEKGWIALFAITLGTSSMIAGNAYSSVLQGMNQIALVRRWETLMSLAAVVSMVVVLMLGGGFLLVILVGQAWTVLTVLRNRWLARRLLLPRLGRARLVARSISPAVLSVLWPSVWRTGVGVLMTYGLLQATAFLVAQTATSAVSAQYSLTLRIMQMLIAFSNVPFYSRLPALASMMAQHRRDDLLESSRRGMSRSLLTYCVGLGGLIVGGPIAFKLIGAKIPFPDLTIFSIFGVAHLVERLGAIHLQLYSLTNHIVWHIANGVSGTLFLIAIVLLQPVLGLVSIPVSHLVAMSMFYLPYAIFLARREFRTTPKWHIAPLGLPTLILGCAFACAAWL